MNLFISFMYELRAKPVPPVQTKNLQNQDLTSSKCLRMDLSVKLDESLVCMAVFSGVVGLSCTVVL